METELYGTLLQAVRLNRSDVFGADDRQMPTSEPIDALVPQIGFVGNDYRPGGTILLGINPGGGGDTYRRTAQDSRLLPLITSLRDVEASPDALNKMFDLYAANMRTWNLWRIAAPVIEACGHGQSEIVYLNWCPFRTRGDKMPHARAMRQSFDAYLAPLIVRLAPRQMIALGMKVGTWLGKAPLRGVTLHVIPRTRGDSYLSPEALVAIERLKKSSRHPVQTSNDE